MPQTVEVRFKGIRRDFFAWPDEAEPLRLREAVVVEAERGQDMGRVHTAGAAAEMKCGSACTSCAVGEGVAEGRAGGRAVGGAEPDAPGGGSAEGAEAAEAAPAAPPPAGPAGLRPVLRRASPDEIRIANELRRAEEDARRHITEKVRQHKLDMKVSDTEWQWDRSKLTVFFTAEKRVDFRALVRDLAGHFRTRMELRQIGVRDEAARLTGVGRCGREYCCSTWLKELSPISLALAKDQHLSLNPAQISGGCGRLLCCLKYEHEFYVTARKRFPREGKLLQTLAGQEKVVAVDIFRERVFLRGDDQTSRIVPLVDLKEELERAAVPGAVAAPPPLADGPPAPAPRPERNPRPERHPRPERDSRPETPRGQRPARPVSPAPAPAPVAAAPEVPAAPVADGRRPGRSRRRRRGRRGGGGSGAGPAPTPES